MATPPNKRFFLSMLYLGLLFLVAGSAYTYLQHFSGTIFLLPGTPESLVFAPSNSGLRLSAAQRGVTPDLLLFDNPASARALRPDENYDAVVLPFFLRLDTADVTREHEARNLLFVEGPAGARTETIAPGYAVALSEGALQVVSIGPWEGLIRDVRGRPMALLEWSVAGDTQKNRLFLEPGRTYVVEPDLAVRFLWHQSASEAQAAEVDSLEEVPGARWGVRDGNATQWIESFIPGTGAVLQDGTRVTLKASMRSKGRITLQVVRGKEVAQVDVAANVPTDTAPWLYEDPAGTGRVLLIHAWREDTALGRLITRDATETATVEPGVPWPLPGGLEVTLTQLMAQAIAAPGNQIRAAYVRAGEKTIALREGLAEKIGDDRLRYQTEAVPPDAVYRFSAIDLQGVVQSEHSVGPGDTTRIGAWVFSLSADNPFAPHGVALTAERRPGGLGQSIGIGMFLVGSFGLSIARFAPRE